MLREASGGFSWQLELIQRYVKGRRNDENDKYVLYPLLNIKTYQTTAFMLF